MALYPTSLTPSIGSVPNAISIGGTSSFEQIVGYRSKLASFSGQLFKDLTKFITAVGSSSAGVKGWAHDGDLRHFDFNTSSLLNVHVNEPVVEAKVLKMVNAISTQTDSIINALLNIGQSFLTQQTTFNIDINKVVTSISTILDKEVGADPNSIYSLRNVVRIFVTTEVLNSAMEMLPGDDDLELIDDSVNAFRDAAKLRFDDEAIKMDRRTINTLISKGMLNSTVGAEVLARHAIKKGNRAWEVIDKEAIAIKLDAITKLWGIKIERLRTRVSAYDMLPVDLPPGIAAALGGIIDRSFVDPRTFVDAFPRILGEGMNSLLKIRELHQTDRRQHVEKHVQYEQLNYELVELIFKNSIQLASSLGKMATFEAS